MRLRTLSVAFCLLPTFAGAMRAQSSSAFFPLKDVRPGLVGVGKTIFSGSQPQTFHVQILGVLKNALSPKRDVILARLSGGPLATTGVIAGMSGSPVYIDGKLLGAVALAFQFSKEPVAGITPIGDMLSVVPQAQTQADAGGRFFRYRLVGLASDPSVSARVIPDSTDGLASLGNYAKWFSKNPQTSPFTNLLLPMSMAGFGPGLVEDYAPLFRSLGFEPMAGGVISGGQSLQPIPGGPQPGSMISMMLVRGDFNVNVDCTVTYRSGDRIFACGHQLLLGGPSQIPFAQARVLATVPDLESSFKVDEPGPLAGTIRQDRFGAIFGVVGEKAPMIPVDVTLDSSLNTTAHYKFDIVRQGFLSPLLLNMGLVATLRGTERSIGPSTLALKGAIQLSDGESVALDNVISADANGPAMAGATVATPLAYLLESDFHDLQVEAIHLTVKSTNILRTATLEQAWSTRSEVRPGEKVTVVCLLRTSAGKIVTEQIPVTIPANVTDPILSLVVGSGVNLNGIESALSPLAGRPRNVQQLVRALNRLRRNNRLYALLMSPEQSLMLEGQRYPVPPPSLVETFLSTTAAPGNVMFSGTSVIGDFETSPTAYAIQGEKLLLLKVESPGS